MARRIEFYFDCSSPWTYLAFHAVQPLAAELGAEIAWKPILVGGVFNTVNQTVYDSRSQAQSAEAILHAEGPRRLGEALRPQDRLPAQGLPGEQREMHARRLRGARRGQAGALRDRCLRGLLGRRPRHLEGGRAGRHRRQGRHRAPTLLRRHRDRLLQGTAARQHRRADQARRLRQPDDVRRRARCSSATTACRWCARRWRQHEQPMPIPTSGPRPTRISCATAARSRR